MSGDQQVPSDETLLGFILGGLSDQENAQVEEALACSESLRLRLRDLRSMLEPLADEFMADPLGDPDHGDPDVQVPSGLVDATMAAIQQQAPLSQQDRASFSHFATEPQWAQSPSNRLAWFDSLITIAAGIVVLSLVLPGILRWRESARQQECAENLRNLGSALGSFALFQPSHRLPKIDPAGPLAFAGIYSIRLQDNQLLESMRWLQCPNDSSSSLLVNVPTSQQFLEAPESKRFVWRMLAGGDYSYNLGSIVEGNYQAPSIESPARVAWIGDRLPLELREMRIAQDSDQEFQQHGTRGLNVLYNDGSVVWLKLPKLGQLATIDHPYLNAELKQAPGIGEADACLGPSHLLPTLRSE
ncbi:MAG: hypothetical protein ACKN85_01580 [Pirellula sp.]